MNRSQYYIRYEIGQRLKLLDRLDQEPIDLARDLIVKAEDELIYLIKRLDEPYYDTFEPCLPGFDPRRQRLRLPSSRKSAF